MIRSKVCGGRALRIVVRTTMLVLLLSAGVILETTSLALATPEQTSTGFIYPTGSAGPYPHGSWLAGGPGMPAYLQDLYHIGQDMPAIVGSDVLAIADGEIIYVSTGSTSGWDLIAGDNNYGLLVKHKLDTGEEFLALYGHVRPNNLMSAGPVNPPVRVDSGIPFATIGPYGTGPHLHFGIHPGLVYPATHWGNMPIDRWFDTNGPDTNGFVNPIEWITTHTPLNSFTAQIIDQSISPTVATPGDELTFVFNVNNPNSEIIENVRLGAQIRTNDPQGTWIDDRDNDIVVTLLPGSHDYSRKFRVPQSTSSGFYDARWVILDDASGNWINSKEMTRIFEIRSSGRSGGPDYMGYTYKDSNVAGGPVYNWEEINTIGTQILPSSDDSYVTNIPVGFFFNYYGTDYSQVGISNNGLIFSGPSTGQYSNQQIGSSSPHGFIAPFWDDIVTWNSADAIYYRTEGTTPNRRFIVEWHDNQGYYSTPLGITFEAILYEGSNNILYQYQTVDFGSSYYNSGASATVGIEGPTGQGLQYSYNEAVLNPEFAILFKFPAFSGTNMYLSKNAPASMDHGNTMTYTLYYNNFGSTVASNVILEDTLPSNVEFISASDSGTYNSATRKVTWNIGSVDVFPSGRGSRNVIVRILGGVSVGTVIQNTALISTTTLETRYDDNSASASTTVTGSNLPQNVGVSPINGISGGTPSVHYSNPITYSYQSSPTATGVDIRIQINDGGPDITGSMTGGPPTWTYMAAPFYPRHGIATVTYSIQSGCSPQYSPSTDVRNSYDNVITANDIEEYIRSNYPNSPMLNEVNIGNSFINAGTTYNVDPAFLVATAELEGRFGTQGWAASHPEAHNTMGYGIPSPDTQPNEINSANSWGAMVTRVAERIANGPYYYNAGRYTVDQIRSMYAGDPNSQSIATMMNAVHCFAQGTESFNIYIDPAGYIYDADTGARIEGASVWLQRPLESGEWENVPINALPDPIMQPDENPLTTGPDGQYQWDVLAGIYRVHVEATGYYPADSYVVNIPPPVFDLHVGLTHLPDSTPPVITNIGATSDSNSAVVSWDTDEASDSLVKYGTSSGSYTFSESSSNMVLSHSVSLTGLTSDTLYYYVVNSTDGSDNSAQSTERTFRTQALADTTPPVIESITLYPVNATPGAIINVTVRASDNVGVIEVKADGTSLIYSNGEWNHGSITAPSTIGSYTVTIRANDSAGNFVEQTANFKVVAPKGSLGVGVSPKTTTAPTTGRTIDYTIKIKSIQNFDDIVRVNITMDGFPVSYQMPLGWFDWNSRTINIASNSTVSLPLRLIIPSGQTPGRKAFKVRANSTSWITTAFDSGVITIS